MAKKSMLERERKRAKMVARYAAKRARLKDIIRNPMSSDDEREAASLYHKLENVLMPLYYRDPLGYAKVMRAATALNGSYFSAQRMMVQYVRNSYRPADPVQLAVLLRNA